ncbi:gamma-glutamylcyclotransferase family protein [Legionella micdadei]|uniref:gamma-glutamylcyclotransferase family protein n=1 Tax=Legionella micdadei TaxID=451 RepID=UPI0009EF773E|nr:gamma-glutamylcyclotransferase family protein [Legionella micdadei]ARG99939.1 UDP-N-acetylmuramate--alanine ligase [Legionella micdadei]
MQKLFSYGTLQLESVQLATFARRLEGRKDSLKGYVLRDLQITDPHVLKVSGKAVHQILVPTNQENDQVEGMVFDLTEAELVKADEYEVDDYVRIKVCLVSGIEAWVYAHRSTLG